MPSYTFTPSILRGAGTRAVPEIPAGSSFPNTFSLSFDGTDDITSGSLSDGTIHGSRTLSFWIKLANNNTNMMIAQFNGSTTSNYFSVRRHSGGSLFIGSKGASANGKSTGALDLTNWTHVLATKTGGGSSAVQTVFINGVETVSGGATVNAGTVSKTIIGKIGTIGYYGGDMEGEIDEISIFEGHLTSSANVSTIYNGGVPGDLTDLNPLLWYRCGDIVNASGSNVPSQGSNTEGDLVLLNDASFSTSVPT